MPLFGRPKAPARKQAQTTKASIEGLQGSIDLLGKREEHLRRRAEDELEKARNLAKSQSPRDKRLALQCLKRKQAYNAQADKLINTRFSLEQQMMHLENASMSVTALEAMQAGASTMRTLQGGLTMDEVDTTIDDIQDTLDVANEISDALSRPFNTNDFEDDDDLMAELDGMVQSDVDAQLLSVGDDPPQDTSITVETPPTVIPQDTTTTTTSDQPTTEDATPAADNEEEDEFAALEKSMTL